MSQTQFKKVFAKGTPEIVTIAKWILDVAVALPDTWLSATDKAVSMSTEVCYGFIRGNSRNVEVNLFVPIDFLVDYRWKESRPTTRKKLITARIGNAKDLTPEFEELITVAHRLSIAPRYIDTNTKKGFLQAVKTIRQNAKLSKAKT